MIHEINENLEKNFGNFCLANGFRYFLAEQKKKTV